MNDPYATLGVSPAASDEEIAKAYRDLAKKYHPDLHPGDQNAAERMSHINKAYDDIKAMRQSGNRQNSQTGQPQHDSYTPGYGPSSGPSGFDPFVYYQSRQYRPRRNPLGFMFFIFMAILLFKLLLYMLTGGYSYYNLGGSGNNRGYVQMPGGYSYYQTYP